MANIFKVNKDVNEHPKRNNFDLSFQNHLTMKLGYLYPVFCRRVVPGDSFKIDTAFGLKFMPMVFPVQSKMRAHMHFFYVRNKNLWKNWENWISGLVTEDEHHHPYLSVKDSDIKSGSIHDFLNVPTTLVSHEAINSFLPVRLAYDDTFVHPQPLFGSFNSSSDQVYKSIVNSTSGRPVGYAGLIDIYQNSVTRSAFRYLFGPVSFVSDDNHFYLTESFASYLKALVTALSENVTVSYQLEVISESSQGSGIFNSLYAFSNVTIVDDSYFTYGESLASKMKELRDNGKNYLISLRVNLSAEVDPTDYSIDLWFGTESVDEGSCGSLLPLLPANSFVDYPTLNLDLYSNHEHINALPYRAYESIYRAYYANSVLQPLRDENDKPVYNEYISNDGDGPDSTDYHLFKRNYELDPYTSAQPSPQQGIAPLVGMTALGNVTIEDENGVTTAHAEIDNDGTVSKVVLTSPAASIEHARTAMNIAAAGMSINDFRAGNALQRLLETSLRKGYRYMDFIAGHFGKEPEYRELDMPEFIGGFSRDVNVTTTFATADTYDADADTGASLGDYVGNASCFGGSSSSVSHYCDDYGFIMGILCVTPTPAYSQIMPKQMICPQNYLDYFFPEMNSLGLQPITYEEVTPIQRYIEFLEGQNKRLQDTFGYQRPYYDYVSAIDEVHGEFRGSMKDFLVNRIFSDSPELGSDFLEINPDEVNDIFVNTTPEDDTIIGQVIMQVHAKRPINRIVIPGLGR